MRSLQNKIHFSCRNPDGFSLIELCIVMVIGGLLLAGILSFYPIKVEQDRQQKLESNRHVIQKALVDFVTDDPLIADDYAGQRYPCPADPSLATGDAGFGVEQTVSANGKCKVVGGIKKVSGAGGDVYIGALPVETLALGGNYSFDPYKRQYTYAVSDTVTQYKSMVNANATGSIKIIGETGATIASGAQFAVVSHGSDGKGGYTAGGTRVPCNAAARDGENCNDDATFRSMNISLGNGASYNDDYVFMALGDDVNDGWLQSTDTTQMHIITKNAGNVGIGVMAGNPTEKLQVVGGNIKTDSDVKADKDVEAGNAMKAKYFFYTD